MAYGLRSGILVLLFLALLLTSVPSPSYSQEGDIVLRVLLKEVPEGQEVLLSLPEGPGVVRAKGQAQGVWLEGKVQPFWEFPGSYFRLDGRTYRGGVRLFSRGGRLLVVNLVPLEDYLLGVLPREMPRGFPREALKAQAVVARTFAVNRLNPKAPYDLCAGEACQVYLGFGVETATHAEAVRATRGKGFELWRAGHIRPLPCGLRGDDCRE